MKQFKNLEEVVDHLYDGLTNEEKDYIIEHGIVNPYLGMQIRNSFGLWWKPDYFLKNTTKWQRFKYRVFGIKPKQALYSPEIPPLVQWFHNRGFYHADDMSSVIIEAFKAKVKDEEYKIHVTYTKIKKHWEKEGIIDMQKEFAPWSL